MEIDPAVDEKAITLAEDIPTVPGRVDVRAKPRNQVDALYDIVKRHDL